MMNLRFFTRLHTSSQNGFFIISVNVAIFDAFHRKKLYADAQIITVDEAKKPLRDILMHMAVKETSGFVLKVRYLVTFFAIHC